MVPHVDTDTLLVELDQRHHLAAAHRLALAGRRDRETHTGAIRWALGTTLLRLGALVRGDNALPQSHAPSGA